jgi:hypothetical protein
VKVIATSSPADQELLKELGADVTNRLHEAKIKA